MRPSKIDSGILLSTIFFFYINLLLAFLIHFTKEFYRLESFNRLDFLKSKKKTLREVWILTICYSKHTKILFTSLKGNIKAVHQILPEIISALLLLSLEKGGFGVAWPLSFYLDFSTAFLLP